MLWHLVIWLCSSSGPSRRSSRVRGAVHAEPGARPAGPLPNVRAAERQNGGQQQHPVLGLQQQLLRAVPAAAQGQAGAALWPERMQAALMT